MVKMWALSQWTLITLSVSEREHPFSSQNFQISKGQQSILYKTTSKVPIPYQRQWRHGHQRPVPIIADTISSGCPKSEWAPRDDIRELQGVRSDTIPLGEAALTRLGVSVSNSLQAKRSLPCHTAPSYGRWVPAKTCTCNFHILWTSGCHALSAGRKLNL